MISKSVKFTAPLDEKAVYLDRLLENICQDSKLIWNETVESVKYSIASPTLDSDKDIGYHLEYVIMNPYSVSVYYCGYYNQDFNNANYSSARQWGGSTTGGDAAASSPYYPHIIAAANSGIVCVSADIIVVKGLAVFSLIKLGNSGPFTADGSHMYKPTLSVPLARFDLIAFDNSTGLQVPGIGPKSTFRMWKKN